MYENSELPHRVKLPECVYISAKDKDPNIALKEANELIIRKKTNEYKISTWALINYQDDNNELFCIIWGYSLDSIHPKNQTGFQDDWDSYDNLTFYSNTDEAFNAAIKKLKGLSKKD
jgi:hypothetical protein